MIRVDSVHISCSLTIVRGLRGSPLKADTDSALQTVIEQNQQEMEKVRQCTVKGFSNVKL